MEAYKQGKREANLSLLGHPCDWCQAPVMRHKARFCTKVCKASFFKNALKETGAANRAATVRKCPTCENDFNPKKTMKEKYCSRKCCYLFPKKCYRALSTCLKYMGEKKKDRTHKLLGYTPQQLQEHIQKHPNWVNVKDGNWHLDHIFPIIAFLEAGIKDISVICSLKNLQPLSELDNCKKNDNYNKEKFEQFLQMILSDTILM